MMIDLHCHILPGVDDGADSLDTALGMAALALEAGVDTVVATPHCNTRSEPKNYRSPALDAAFDGLRRALREETLPLTVHTGSEVLLHGDVGALLDTQRLYTLGGSRYLLVEFYFDEQPAAMEDMLQAVAAHDYVPVIAHPERYFCVQDLPDIAARWQERGWVLQLNKGSILGDLGEGPYDTARRFLRDGLCGVIASDAHHYAFRTPRFDRLLDELEYFFPQLDPAQYLEKNPARILTGQSL